MQRLTDPGTLRSNVRVNADQILRWTWVEGRALQSLDPTFFWGRRAGGGEHTESILSLHLRTFKILVS